MTMPLRTYESQPSLLQLMSTYYPIADSFQVFMVLYME